MSAPEPYHREMRERAARFCEKHPSDRRRQASTIVLSGDRLALCDSSLTRLAAVFASLALLEVLEEGSWVPCLLDGAEMSEGDGDDPAPASQATTDPSDA